MLGMRDQDVALSAPNQRVPGYRYTSAVGDLDVYILVGDVVASNRDEASLETTLWRMTLDTYVGTAASGGSLNRVPHDSTFAHTDWPAHEVNIVTTRCMVILDIVTNDLDVAYAPGPGLGLNASASISVDMTTVDIDLVEIRILEVNAQA